MATIKQGILGAFSGKVAGVVGSSWKGIPVMKSLPPSVANPKTAKQIEQRDRMSACTAFATAILADVLKPLNDRFSSRMSGFNAFTKANIANFATGVLSAPSSVSISPSMHKAQLIDAIAAEAKLTKKDAKVHLEWTSDEGTGLALPTDRAFVVVYNRTTKKTFGQESTAIRDNEELDFFLPDDEFEPGDVVDVYFAFLREDGTVAFSTAYATTTLTTAPA